MAATPTIAGLPWNFLPITKKLSIQLMRRLFGQPNGSVGALFDRARRVRSAHVRPNPSGTHRVDGDAIPVKHLGEHDRQTVERQLRQAITGLVRRQSSQLAVAA